MPTVAELADEYITCRTRRHVWDDLPDDGGGGHREFVASSHIIRLMARCTRCGTIRYEAWSTVTGEILFPPAYKYPEGYKVTGGLKPFNARQEYARRMMEKQRDQEKQQKKAGKKR